MAGRLTTPSPHRTGRRDVGRRKPPRVGQRITAAPVMLEHEAEAAMGEEREQGASEVDATPDAAERSKPKAPEPGTTSGTSEADAAPAQVVPETKGDLKW